MRPGRAYDALTWGSAGAVAALIVAGWAALLAAHVGGPGAAVQVDRKLILSKLAVMALAFGAVAVGMLGVAWKTWRRSSPVLLQECAGLVRGGAVRGPALRGALAAAARDAAAGGMDECEDFQQWAAHLLIMWGFLGLFATTALDALVNHPANPLPLLHPVRLLGNVSGVAFMAGLTLAIARRALNARVRSTAGDWVFLWSLWGTGATGFLLQWTASLGDLRDTRLWYPAHLALIVAILLFAPWSKFLHAVWRPSWALYRRLVEAQG